MEEKGQKETTKNNFNKIIWIVLIVGIVLSLIVGTVVTKITYSKVMDFFDNKCKEISYEQEVIEDFERQALVQSIKKGAYYAIIPLYITLMPVVLLKVRRNSKNKNLS